MIVTAGAVNRSLYFYIQEDAGSANPGEPVTGLLFSNLDSASYARQGAARVAITPITLASASAVHADGGFILVDDTNMPGTYRLDVPDAAFLTGVDQVVVQIDPGATRVCAPILADITDVDLRDAVRGGMTALPNAAADAALGLPISDAGGLNLDAMNVNVNDIETSTAGLAGAAMRGTDSAALATVATELRLAELDPANLPSDVDAILLDTGTTLDAKINDLQGATFVEATDSNEAIRNKIDGGVDIAAGGISNTSFAAAAIDAAAIAANAIGAAELASDAIDKIWDKVCEDQGSVTSQEIMSLVLSALMGVTSGGGLTLSSPNGVSTRIVGTVDASNNRLTITLTPSAGA